MKFFSLDKEREKKKKSIQTFWVWNIIKKNKNIILQEDLFKLASSQLSHLSERL